MDGCSDCSDSNDDTLWRWMSCLSAPDKAWVSEIVRSDFEVGPPLLVPDSAVLLVAAGLNQAGPLQELHDVWL